MNTGLNNIRRASRYFAGLIVAVSLAAPLSGAYAGDGGGRGDAYDADTGMLCLTIICDYVRKRGSNECICNKVWPNNDRRQRVQLECTKSVGGRWVSC